MSELKIGWAEADITPDGEVDLYGQYYPRLSQGIHSRLGATVMAIENGEDQAVMVSVDLVNFTSDFLDDLRGNLKGRIAGLELSNILMNATHTHCAPGVSPGRSWWEPTNKAVEFRALVIDRISDAVVRAWDCRKPAGIAASCDFANVGHNRRAVYENGTAEMYGDVSRDDFMGMEGGEDSCVETVFIFDESKKPVGMIVNVACPSQVMEATYLISSDYMGKVRRLMKEKFGDDFYTLCQISAAGCQSPRDLIRTRDNVFWCEKGVEVLGRKVYDAVLRSFEKIDSPQFDVKFSHSVKNISLPRRRASYKEYRAAQKYLERLQNIMPREEAFKAFCEEVKTNEAIPGRPGPYDSKLHHFSIIRNNEAVIKRYEEQDESPYFDMELHVLRLGECVFATNPFELFLDFGQQIKARSKASQTFIIQLSCGAAAYLPTERAEQLGGYGALIINGVVGSDGGKRLVDETLKEIETLWT